MKKIGCFTILALLLISILTSCSTIEKSKVTSTNTVNSQVQNADETVTYPLHIISRDGDSIDNVIPNINLIILDSNGKTVGTTKTGKDGVADITVTVPIDKRYDSKIGTVTVIAYNNDKYRRTVMYEVPVAGGGEVNQNIIMIPKTGYRDDEVNITYGNINHLFVKSLADKYVPWNEK